METQGNARLENVGSRIGCDVRVAKWKGHRIYKWRCSFVEAGKRKQKGFKTKDAAEEWAEARKKDSFQFGTDAALTVSERSTVVETRKGLNEVGLSLSDAVQFAIRYHKQKSQSLTIQELVEKALAKIKSDGLSITHLQSTKRHLDRFANDFGKEPATTIEPETVSVWLNSLESKFSSRTINHHRASLRKLFNQLGRNHQNPVADVNPKKVIGSEIEVISPKEISKIISVACEEILPAFVIGAFAGIRDSEIKRLDWSNIDLEAGSILVTAKNAKTSSQRRVPIEANLSKWLKTFAKTSGPVWPENGRKLHDESKLKAGFGNPENAPEGVALKKWPHNALRHSYASYHLAQHKKAAELALNMGHENTSMIFKHYRQVVSEKSANNFWAISPEEPTNVIEIAC
ncbi:tyrosine-type recombinase/integrase [Verrucomicrobiales bacterium]|nr:tyrosine-type recombinase/integrase [Verrucomicrobiales bacterium]